MITWLRRFLARLLWPLAREEPTQTQNDFQIFREAFENVAPVHIERLVWSEDSVCNHRWRLHERVLLNASGTECGIGILDLPEHQPVWWHETWYCSRCRHTFREKHQA